VIDAGKAVTDPGVIHSGKAVGYGNVVLGQQVDTEVLIVAHRFGDAPLGA
jgi:hypothetical protein